MAVPYLPLIGEVCDGFIVEREGESAADVGMQQKGGISFQKPDEKASRSTNGPKFRCLVPEQNSPLVVQELQTGGTSPPHSGVRRNVLDLHGDVRQIGELGQSLPVMCGLACP
jgi:hypothetical protein